MKNAEDRNGRGDSAAKNRIAARERIEKLAFFSLKLLRASLPLGEEPAGLCVKRDDSWTVSYGDGNTVDLPPLADAESVMIFIEGAELPFPRIISRKGRGQVSRIS